MLYFISWSYASGAAHYFSPYTLKTHAQRETLLPMTELPVYRSRPQTHYYYPLVQYLIEHGHWAPLESDAPPIQVSRWNRQWKGGVSDLHRQLAWRSDSWIEWSEAHPQMAARLWPDALKLLRSDSRSADYYASQLMSLARFAKTPGQFQQMIADDANLVKQLNSVPDGI